MLQQFRELAQGVVAKAERLLWEELLWMREHEHRPTTRLAEIQDDVSIRQRGVCYLSQSQLQQGQAWVLDRLARVAGAQKLYQQRVGL